MIRFKLNQICQNLDYQMLMRIWEYGILIPTHIVSVVIILAKHILGTSCPILGMNCQYEVTNHLGTYNLHVY